MIRTAVARAQHKGHRLGGLAVGSDSTILPFLAISSIWMPVMTSGEAP